MEELYSYAPVWIPEDEPLQSCTSLDLNKKELSAFPIGLSLLSNLGYLAIGSNQISEIPSWISRLLKLQGLQMDKNELTALPDELFSLRNLVGIGIHENKLSSIPERISQLRDLQYLNAWENEISSIPEGISRLNDLIGFGLNNNKLTSLPNGISRLTNMEGFNVQSNKISALPDGISLLTKMTILFAGDNELTGLPDGISRLTKVSQLILGNNKLSFLPAWISHLTRLETLNLSKNQLTALPNQVSCLNKLTNICFDENKLSVLPEGISCLSLLESLALCDMHLTSLVEGVSRLTKLTALQMYTNKLSELPFGLSCLTNLEVFNIYENNFTMVPEFISSFQKLNFLNVRNNTISHIPSWISRLTNITFLGVRNNPIEALPCEITHLKKLSDFIIEDAEGNISIMFAPRNISLLPCWENNQLPQPNWKRSYADSLRHLTLYDGTIPPDSLSLKNDAISTMTIHSGIEKIASNKELHHILSDLNDGMTTLGIGSLGTSFRKKWTNKQDIVIKRLKNGVVESKAKRQSIIGEIHVLSKVCHPSLCSVLAFGCDSQNDFYVMEYATDGSLWDVIEKEGVIDRHRAVLYGIQISEAILVLHKNNPPVCHGCLKPENILLSQGATKICDFGLQIARSLTFQNKTNQEPLHYAPPEFHGYHDVTEAGDVYSLGLVLWTIIHGKRPFAGLSYQEITDTKGKMPMPPFTEPCSIPLVDLIKRCCSIQPAHRPNIQTVHNGLLDIHANPGKPFVAANKEGKAVEYMNNAELADFLESNGLSSKFVSMVKENLINGTEFLSLKSEDLLNSPFNLPHFYVRIVVCFIERIEKYR